jgi:2-keto-4-pentenoate hydratase/2-oxohepta-3-ene-1,7-dioic acid hydratase in catechol pathway
VKFLTFSVDGRESYGVATADGVVDLGKRFGDEYPTLKELIAAGLPLSAHVAEVAGEPPDYAIEHVTFLPPIADPVHIWCLALNYVEHHSEVQERPDSRSRRTRRGSTWPATRS